MKDTATGSLFSTKINKPIIVFNNYHIEQHIGLEVNEVLITYRKENDTIQHQDYMCRYMVTYMNRHKDFVVIEVDGKLPEDMILIDVSVYNKNIILLDTVNKVRKTEIVKNKIKLSIWSDKIKNFTSDIICCKLFFDNKKVYDGILESITSNYEYSNCIYKYDVVIGLPNNKTFNHIDVAVFEKNLD